MKPHIVSTFKSALTLAAVAVLATGSAPAIQHSFTDGGTYLTWQKQTISADTTSSGAENAALLVSNGSIVDVPSGVFWELTTTGDGAHGAWVTGASLFNGYFATIVTGGEGAHGVLVDGDSSAMLSGSGQTISNITTTGDYAHGVRVEGAEFTGNTLEILTTGEFSHAISLVGGTATIFNEKRVYKGKGSTEIPLPPPPIATTGDNSHALSLEEGSVLEATGRGLDLYTSGADSYGAYVDGGSSLTLLSTNIQTEEAGSTGIYLSNGSHAELDVWIRTTGDGAMGVYAEGGSTAEGYTMDIETEGDMATGIAAYGEGTVVDFVDSDIVTHGFAAYGVLVSSGAEVRLTDTRITTTGNNSHGVSMSGSTTFTGENLEIVVTGANSDGIFFRNDTGTLTLNNTVITGSNDAGNIYGIRMDSNGYVEGQPTVLSATNLVVNLTGDASTGLWVWGNRNAGVLIGDKEVYLDNATFNLTGNFVTGMTVDSAKLTGNGLQISIDGNNVIGLIAAGLAQVSATNVTLSTNGVGAIGFAIQGGSLSIDGLDLQMEGAGSSAVTALLASYDGPTHSQVEITNANLYVAQGTLVQAISLDNEANTAEIVLRGLNNATKRVGDILMAYDNTSAENIYISAHLNGGEVQEESTGKTKPAPGGLTTLYIQDSILAGNIISGGTVGFMGMEVSGGAPQDVIHLVDSEITGLSTRNGAARLDITLDAGSRWNVVGTAAPEEGESPNLTEGAPRNTVATASNVTNAGVIDLTNKENSNLQVYDPLLPGKPGVLTPDVQNPQLNGKEVGEIGGGWKPAFQITHGATLELDGSYTQTSTGTLIAAFTDELVDNTIVIANGEVTLGGTLDFTLESPQADLLYIIINNLSMEGTYGTFEEIYLNGAQITLDAGGHFTQDGVDYVFTYGGIAETGDITGGNDVFLQVQAVPEPGTWAAMLVGGLGVLAWTRRVRRATAVR